MYNQLDSVRVSLSVSALRSRDAQEATTVHSERPPGYGAMEVNMAELLLAEEVSPQRQPPHQHFPQPRKKPGRQLTRFCVVFL